MFINQSRLLDVLLTAATSKNKHDNEKHYIEASKEIGLIYGVLMKRRNHTLSRVQRVVTMAMAEENVYQKV